MKLAKIVVAIILLVAALMGSAVCALAIIDPAGAKAADDSDPFGVPPSRGVSFAMLSGFIAVGGFGLWLLRKPPGSSIRPN